MDNTTTPEPQKPGQFDAAHGCIAPVEITQRAGSGVLGVGGASEFRAEGVTLILGNCLDYMPIIADAVISDPPYGIGYMSPKTRKNTSCLSRPVTLAHANRNAGETIIGDDAPFDPAVWLEYKIVVLWGADKYKQRLPQGGTMLVWDKASGRGPDDKNCDAEIAWTNQRVARNIYPHLWKGLLKERDGEEGYGLRGANTPRLHVAQKPVNLMAWAMDRAKVPGGATVLDPFMGSGSTAIACIRTGRKFIGVECDPKHFATAVQRVRAELAQGLLSLGGGVGFSVEPSPLDV